MTKTVTPDCGHRVAVEGVGTGYAVLPDGKTVCYSCSDEMERTAFHAADRFVAYVDSGGDRLTTWPGGHLAMNTGHTSSRNNFGGMIHRWWFQDRQGGRWYGQNAGKGMVIQVRRIKS